MKLNRPDTKIFIPDGTTIEKALERTTHMGIGAHQDDLEIMASHGIAQCFNQKDKWFTGIVCTNGIGSVRSNKYSDINNERLANIRVKEQEEAAKNGDYGAVVQLSYSSQEVKETERNLLRDDLISIIKRSSPSIIYTHNLADKHQTHVSVSITTIEAIRTLPKKQRPLKVYGCEVWKTLDWMKHEDKIALDLSGNEEFISSLIKVYHSQIDSGKRYDLATIGRMRSNATYHESHSKDSFSHLWYAMDLTPLIDDPQMDISEYVNNFIERFKDEVSTNLKTIIKNK